VSLPVSPTVTIGVVAFWGSSIYRGDDRRADWAFGFGLVAAASLVGVVATRSEDLVQALLGLMFLGSSVTALVLGLVVLGRRHVLAKVTVQKAFIGVALGSLVAVAVGFWVLSLIFAIHQGQNSLPFLSQENRITLNCVNAEERSGVPLGQAFDDCSGCPSSESRVEPVTGNGVNGTSSSCLVSTQTSWLYWPLAAIPFGSWLVVMAVGWRLLFRRPYRPPPPAPWPA